MKVKNDVSFLTTRQLFCFLLLNVLLFCVPDLHAEMQGQIHLDSSQADDSITYALRLPQNDNITVPSYPILICSGGVPMQDDRYVRSSTQECDSPFWYDFADQNGFAILGVGFLLDIEDWQIKKSYQFSRAWSGELLQRLLKKLAKKYPLATDELYLYGVSGGAQFSLRFAAQFPKSVRAVAAHAAGSYDPPTAYHSVKYLITVGALDNEPFRRLDMAQEFVAALNLFGISHQLMVIEGLNHRQTMAQDQKSQIFFQSVLKHPLERDEIYGGNPLSLPIGLAEDEFFKRWPKDTIRFQRFTDEDHFATYRYGLAEEDFITMHLRDGMVFNWGLNDRREMVDQFLNEFCSPALIRGYPKTFKAIRRVLQSLPDDVFKKTTNRERPILFMDVLTTGIARYANAIDFHFRPDDPPAFQRGFYMIRLGHDLETAQNEQAIDGILYHEIAHHILDHLRRPQLNCELEREANQWVKALGFSEAFQQASSEFGAKQKGDSPCFDPSQKTK